MKVMGTDIKGVVFDLDETLVNSKNSIVAYHRELFKFLGLPFPEEHAYWFYTLPAEEITNRLFPDESYRERAREFRKTFDFRQLFRMVTPKPGIPEVLVWLRERGKRLAVVTNRGISTRPLLEHLGLTEYFDEILPANEIPHNKPHPYPLEFLMEKWDITPREMIYIGDSEIDVETGKNAGVITVTVGNRFEGVEFLQSLEELPGFILSLEEKTEEVVG